MTVYEISRVSDPSENTPKRGLSSLVPRPTSAAPPFLFGGEEGSGNIAILFLCQRA